MRNVPLLSPLARVLLPAILCVLMPAAGLHAAPDKDLPPDLALVPANGAGFVSVRVADLWNSDSSIGLRKLAKEDATFRELLDAMSKHLGLTTADVERGTFIFPDNPQDEPLGVLTTVKAYDRTKILAALVPDAQEKKVGGKSYHVSQKGPSTAVSFVNERTILVASAKTLEAFLQRPAPKEAGGTLSPALAVAADKSHTLVAGLNMAAYGDELKKIPEGPGAEVKVLAPILYARGGIVVVDVGKAMDVRMTLPFDTEDAAKDGEKSLRAGLDMITQVLPKGIAELEKAPESPTKILTGKAAVFLKDLLVGFKEAKIERGGKVVGGKLHVESPDAGTGLVLTVATFFIVRSGPRDPGKPTDPRQ